MTFDQCCYNTRWLGELIKKPTEALKQLYEFLSCMFLAQEIASMRSSKDGRCATAKDEEFLLRIAASHSHDLGQHLAELAADSLMRAGIFRNPPRS